MSQQHLGRKKSYLHWNKNQLGPRFLFCNMKYQETIRTLLAHLEPYMDGLGNGSPSFKSLHFLLGKVLSVWILLHLLLPAVKLLY